MSGKPSSRVSVWLEPEPRNWWVAVDDEIEFDIGIGDVTSSFIDVDSIVSWRIEAQSEGVLCGVGIVDYLFHPLPGDPNPEKYRVHVRDGEPFSRGTVIAEGAIPAPRALASERTALNFLMHLSGVATLTAEFVRRVEGTRARIVDTRKTLPGLRILQKYAVRCGGGHNHRTGLFDGVLIKDNHIQSAGSISHAIESVRRHCTHLLRVEVECETLEQVAEAVESKADIILLDNMDPFMMRQAVKSYGDAVLFEASGGINLDTVRGVAQTGVAYISVGAITHSAPSVPFHLEFS